MKIQLVCAVVILQHPASYGIKHFSEMFEQMTLVTTPYIMVLDMVCDTELVHQMIRNENVISMIPAGIKSCLNSRTKGRYRKIMRREFDKIFMPSKKQV